MAQLTFHARTAASRRAQADGTKPVTRTYNTLMIACNASGQWQEALNIYESEWAAPPATFGQQRT
jgi:pentatricopeptide repeat protein